MVMIRLATLFLLFCFSGLSSAQQALPFYNAPGAYGIGLRVVRQYDPSRTYAPAPEGAMATQRPAGRGRPIQTAIWYPAKNGASGNPMRYDDYLNLLGWDDDFDRTPAAQAKVVADWLKMVTGDKPAAQVAAEHSDVLWAVRDAEAVPGKFPVVVYAPSLSSNVFENAEMMEFLASHGYIVIASPGLGVRTRGQKADLEHAEAQAADIRFLVDFAHTLPNADPSRLTAMGFSWGGLSNVLAAARDERIKALVCLDGSVRYWNRLMDAAPYASPEKLRTPLLFLAQRPAPFERNLDFKPDLSGSFLRKMKNADVYLLTMYAMEHVYFGTSYLRLDPLEFDEYTRDEVAQAHGLATRYVLHFLNGTMKNDPAGLAYLRKKPGEIGAPAHSVRSQFFPARPDMSRTASVAQ
jgi:dienelactone hydrolase